MTRTARIALPAVVLWAGLAMATGAKPHPVAVTIEAFQFSPSELKVPRGTTVTFVNKDATPHTVTPKVPGSFQKTGRILSGASKTVTFDKAGTFDYFCEIHTTMTGMVVVQ